MIKFGRKNGNILKALKGAAKSGGNVLEVGWFADQTHENDIPIAKIAAFQEYGGVTHDGYNVPARPFMRPTREANKGDWSKYIKKSIKDGLRSGNLNIENVLGRLGMVIQGQIQEAIADVDSPPLSEYTIKKRLQRYAGGNKTDIDQGAIAKPLVDTGIMISSVQARVRTK